MWNIKNNDPFNQSYVSTKEVIVLILVNVYGGDLETFQSNVFLVPAQVKMAYN